MLHTEWRTYRDFVGYRISESGVVQSAWEKLNDGNRGFRRHLGTTWRTIKAYKNSEGYFMVGFVTSSKRKTLKIHQLMLELFGPPMPFIGALALHRDDNKEHNALSNLYWGTPRDNQIDKILNGRGGSQKLTPSAVSAIRQRNDMGISHAQIAREFSVSRSQVSRIVLRQRWSFVG